MIPEFHAFQCGQLKTGNRIKIYTINNLEFIGKLTGFYSDGCISINGKLNINSDYEDWIINTSLVIAIKKVKDDGL